MNSFIISSRDLYTKCEKLGRVINSKNTLPVLDNLLFTVENGMMRISSSDTENFATGLVEVNECEGSFEFGLNARTFVSALKELPEQPLTIVVEESGCTIKYANGHFNLPIADVTEYPKFPNLKESSSLTISGESFKRVLSKAPAFAGQDELRPIMNGICFSYENQKLEAVASDGHGLIKLTEPCMNADKCLFVMSIKSAKLAESFMAKDEESVTIIHSESHSYIKFASFELTSRLVEGRYPNYNAVIPVDYTDNIEVERTELISIVRRVSVFANTASQLLKFDINGMNLGIIGEDIDFSHKAEASMMIVKTGKDLAIGLKGTIVQPILAAFNNEKLKMFYKDSSRAVVFREVDENEDHTQMILLMPMMLNN